MRTEIDVVDYRLIYSTVSEKKTKDLIVPSMIVIVRKQESEY